jgi:hypothetical protein
VKHTKEAEQLKAWLSPEAREGFDDVHDYFAAVVKEINLVRPERHARVSYDEGLGIELDALDHPEDVHWCVSSGSEFWGGVTSDNRLHFTTTIEHDRHEWPHPAEMAEAILVSLAKYVTPVR